MGLKITVILLIGFLALAYQATRPPLPNICGFPDGPAITAPRITLRDGRQLAYKEHGVLRNLAKYKIIFFHGMGGSRHNAPIAENLPPEFVEEVGLYIVSFDRPGYGESDPDPKRTPKSLALDTEELADQLGLGSKFYIAGFSMGGQAVWSCLKYIPQRLVGAALLAPATNYWWPGFPANLSDNVYHQLLTQDQWALRVTHYAPRLTYWWNTQRFFPRFAFFDNRPEVLSSQDLEIKAKLAATQNNKSQALQQGLHESVHRDMMIGFGAWEFDPMDLENPFSNGEGSVHLWQGDEDRLVPVLLQRYISKRLPWIHYHELPGSGHMFPYAEGMSEIIVKTLLLDDQATS